jgi:Na+/H+ antiporter
LATLARRFHTPYPIMLVVGGLVLSLVPHLPRISLDPDIIFLVFLPPLLYFGAFHTSWRDFRANLTTILLLAFGLVGFTVLGVALGAGWLLRGFDAHLGALLGAVVCTTDSIAATAIAKRVGLPRRITEILEGESLVNDASGLLALQFTVALVVTGQHPTISAGFLELLWLVSGGILVGLITAVAIHKISRGITDAPIEIVLSLVTPYVAYLGAEGIHASGVLATVACGLYLGGKNSETLSINARLESSAVWQTLDFILNGIVFVLIGLQLPFILRGIRDRSMLYLIVEGALFAAFIIALRVLWVFPGAWTTYLVNTKLLHRPVPRPTARQIFIVGWTGMRGVLALAAAISLPETLADGSPFPQRNVIIFLAFCVIFVTLVLQGLTLPMLIRKLGLSSGQAANLEEQEARRQILNTVLDYLRKLQSNAKTEHADIYEDLARHYGHRLTLAESAGNDQRQKEELALIRYYKNLSQELRALERTTALNLHNENKINDEVLRTLERELDLAEVRFQHP